MHHLCALTCDSLRYLALVVREDEVHAASVDVEVVAQILASHSCAFAVPSREAVAPRTGPSHDVFGLCGFPEGKVRLVLLLAHAGQIATCVLDVLEVSAREDAPAVVLVVLLDVEVDAAVALVGIAVVEDLADELLLLDDVARGVRLDAWRQTSQGVHRLVEAVGVVLRHLHRLELLESCLLGNLVLALVGIVLEVAYVRDVPHVTHLVADVLQIAKQEVEGNGRTCVPEVSVAIDSWAADIHANATGIERLEEFLLPTQGIINQEWLFHIKR